MGHRQRAMMPPSFHCGVQAQLAILAQLAGQSLTTSAHKHSFAAARHTETWVKDVANGDGHLAVERAALVPTAWPLGMSLPGSGKACAAREQNHIHFMNKQCRPTVQAPHAAAR